MKNISIALVLAGLLAPLSADQVIVDDLIVSGSQCLGQDCVNGENFGFDTLRLKENNTRIKFDDTSSTGGFPNHDWQLTANDSTNGGMNKFSIEDTTASRIPFTIEGSAPTASLYVDDGGRVGLGTSSPVVDLHMKSGNTPTMRLDQDGSSGFTSQVWDVAANETNFFIRDATNGSKLPFKIVPGAPTNSMYINSSGKVGLGTASPDAPLHVQRSDGTAKIHVTETSVTTAKRELLRLENNGDWMFSIRDTADNVEWRFATGTVDGQDNAFALNEVDNEIYPEFIIKPDGSISMGAHINPTSMTNVFRLSASGDLTIEGGLTELSDQNSKENIIPIDVSDVLKNIVSLPISKWNYIDNDDSIKHIGAMAQDFYKAFQLGNDEKHISSRDVAFVAISGIQALKKELDSKNNEIDKLNKKIADLEAIQARMINLELMVQELANAKNMDNLKTLTLQMNP